MGLTPEQEEHNKRLGEFIDKTHPNPLPRPLKTKLGFVPEERIISTHSLYLQLIRDIWSFAISHYRFLRSNQHEMDRLAEGIKMRGLVHGGEPVKFSLAQKGSDYFMRLDELGKDYLPIRVTD
jgi:hypothetical protein